MSDVLKKEDFRIVTLAVIAHKNEVRHIINEMDHCGGHLGIYCIQSGDQEATQQQVDEMEAQVPAEILEGYVMSRQ